MWPNPQFSSYLVIFTEEVLNGKLHFCVVMFPCHGDVQIQEMFSPTLIEEMIPQNRQNRILRLPK